MRFLRWVVGALVLVACGTDGGTSNGTRPSGDQAPDGGSSGSDGPGIGGDSTAPVPYAFRYGINLGNGHEVWGDSSDAQLSSALPEGFGVRSVRVRLPAPYLQTAGMASKTAHLQTYASLGMKDQIGLLIGSETLEKSTAPVDSPESANELWIPKNLYEPIYQADGKINPSNYWASYVFNTVSTYKEWIKVWQVWDEPDWVSDDAIVEAWRTDPPTMDALPHFNGSIFDYVRMLRITKEAARTADPEAIIATGGLSHPSFLDALLRYTDNPNGGAASTAYPATGARYFDVLDFHYFPLPRQWNSDTAIDGFVTTKKELEAVLATYGKTVRGWNVSATGAPEAVPMGGSVYSQNYVLKLFPTALANGIGGVDWFKLFSSDDESDPFSQMGIFRNTPGNLTYVGRGFFTLNRFSKELAGATYDSAATTALGFPAGARGFVFAKEGKRRLIVWSEPNPKRNEGEALTPSVELATATGFDAISGLDGTSVLEPVEGKATVPLTTSPILLIER